MNVHYLHQSSRLDALRGEYNAMVDCAWALRASAAHYRMWAKQADALNDNERYQSLKAKAKAKFREARRYVQWARQRQAEMEAIRVR